jgi:hypothetical protein
MGIQPHVVNHRLRRLSDVEQGDGPGGVEVGDVDGYVDFTGPGNGLIVVAVTACAGP